MDYSTHPPTISILSAENSWLRRLRFTTFEIHPFQISQVRDELREFAAALRNVELPGDPTCNYLAIVSFDNDTDTDRLVYVKVPDARTSAHAVWVDEQLLQELRSLEERDMILIDESENVTLNMMMEISRRLIGGGLEWSGIRAEQELTNHDGSGSP